jgi:disulfide bond formation protein DsbB
MVETMQNLTALLAIVAGGGAVLIVLARVLASRVPAAAAAGRAVIAVRAPLTFAVAAVATAGSLYFSESAGYIPCRLCWFQRIAMYPIAVIALVALLRRDRAARWYILPLAVVGAAISTYHVLIEWGWLNDSESCALFGPSCADVWFEAFGFVTLALMALAGFVSIIVLNTVSFDSVDPQENS